MSQSKSTGPLLQRHSLLKICISIRGSKIVGVKSLALNFALPQVLLMVFKGVRGSTIVGVKSLALNFALPQVLLMVFKGDKSLSVSLG